MFRAPLRWFAGAWEYRRGRRRVRCDPKHDPGIQVTRQATALHDFLARHGIDRFVEHAIALAEAVPAAHVAASPIKRELSSSWYSITTARGSPIFWRRGKRRAF
jgi:hypothetical protein